MKKNLSRLLITLLTISTLLAFTGCSDDKASDGQVSGDAPKKIGIVQIMEHPSLNTIRETMIAELAANGFVDGENIAIDYQNAQSDPTNLKTICQKFTTGGYDMIIAIATPSAQSAAGEDTDIPIIFSAVTDPIAAGLVSSMEKPGGNITGTSDAVSATKIMDLAKQITPNIKTIGALYNPGEANSLSVIKELKEYAAQNGISVVDATVTNSSEVQQAATSLVGKVDAMFTPIDNTVATAMPVVSQIAKDAKLPMYVGADSLVADGGLATYGISYDALGKETALMAIRVLNGENPGSIPVKTLDDVQIFINSDTAKAIGITFPQQVLSAATDLK